MRGDDMIKHLISRRETILFTTIDLMDKNGVNNVSTKEIAKAEGITEAAIYKHFDKKIDILKAVLSYFSKYDQDIFDGVVSRAYEPLEAIEKYFEAYATYYQNYSAITVIFQAFEELRLNEELKEDVVAIYNQRMAYIIKLVELAKEAGRIGDRDPLIIADILLGTFSGICLKWRMANYSFNLKENSQIAINTLMSMM